MIAGGTGFSMYSLVHLLTSWHLNAQKYLISFIVWLLYFLLFDWRYLRQSTEKLIVILQQTVQEVWTRNIILQYNLNKRPVLEKITVPNFLFIQPVKILQIEFAPVPLAPNDSYDALHKFDVIRLRVWTRQACET